MKAEVYGAKNKYYTDGNGKRKKAGKEIGKFEVEVENYQNPRKMLTELNEKGELYLPNFKI